MLSSLLLLLSCVHSYGRGDYARQGKLKVSKVGNSCGWAALTHILLWGSDGLFDQIIICRVSVIAATVRKQLQAMGTSHQCTYNWPVATSTPALVAARIAAVVCCCLTTPSTAMLAQLQLQPAPWRRPSCSRLVCHAGKAKQAKHKPQRPAKRKPGRSASTQRSPSGAGLDLDALLSAAGLGDERVAPFHKEFAAAVKASGLG